MGCWAGAGRSVPVAPLAHYAGGRRAITTDWAFALLGGEGPRPPWRLRWARPSGLCADEPHNTFTFVPPGLLAVV